MPIQYGLLTKKQLNAVAALLPDVGLTAATSIYAIGAVKNNYICGILIFRADGELLIDIQYIAVAKPYRRQGIATGLLDFLCKSAWESTTAIFCTFAAADWDEPLCRLFIRRGDFTLTEAEGYICRFPCKELSKLKLNTAPPTGTHIATFYDLPKWVQNRFLNEMKKDSLAFSEGIRVEYEQMLRPLCICVVDSSENIQAAFFCQEREQDVELSLAYGTPGHVHALAALLSHLRRLLLSAGDHISYLWIAAVTPQSRKLVEKLLPEREVMENFYTACWDMNNI